jgi:membrane protein DedA with SNARE-associated domain
LYKRFGIWIVAAGGFTPIPYKVITIFSGLIKMNFLEFLITSFFSRGARFFLIATLLYFYGKKIEYILIKRFGFISFLIFLILILVYLSLKYLNYI